MQYERNFQYLYLYLYIFQIRYLHINCAAIPYKSSATIYGRLCRCSKCVTNDNRKAAMFVFFGGVKTKTCMYIGFTCIWFSCHSRDFVAHIGCKRGYQLLVWKKNEWKSYIYIFIYRFTVENVQLLIYYYIPYYTNFWCYMNRICKNLFE